MDVYIEILGMRFSWQDKKLRLNERNHNGISLEEAADAFLDPDVVLISARHATADERKRYEARLY